MANYMPELEAFFHYRNLDVSSLKELVKRWKPDIQAGLQKKSTHQALEDIKDSVNELNGAVAKLAESGDRLPKLEADLAQLKDAYEALREEPGEQQRPGLLGHDRRGKGPDRRPRGAAARRP